MHFTLTEVHADDAELLIRNCEFPAMRNDPLQLIMFPNSTEATEQEEIRWMIDGLRDTLGRQRGSFRMVCLEDGTPVGFAGWSLEQVATEKKSSATREDSGNQPKEHHSNNKKWHPETLDVESWVGVSKMRRDEKHRVLNKHSNIWRLMTISVNPKYQRHGVGSMLLQWGCKMADDNKQDSFLIASPAGIPLYSKFGFRFVGELQTTRGTFRSMLREHGAGELKIDFCS